MRKQGSGPSLTIPRTWKLGTCLLSLLVLLLAGGCGGDRLAQPVTPAVGGGDAENVADSAAPRGFPGLPPDAYVDPQAIVARRGNYLSERTRLGDEYFAKAENATVNATGHFVQLIAGERQPSWAVYRFDDLLDEDAPLVLTVELLPQLADSHYLGLADYASGKWQWHEIADQPQGYTVGISAKLDLVSPGGSVYVAVLVWDGDPAVIVSLTLGAHVIAPAPVGLEASDGGYGSRIVLTWEDPAITYPGLEYDAVQIERENRTEDTWELIAEVVPGTVTYSDVHDGADNNLWYESNYYYRLKTVEEGVAGMPSPQDSGYREFPPVTGVSATDGEYFDKVVITWDPMDEADGYVITYAGWMNEPSDLAEVSGGDTTSFEHTAYSPATAPCEYGQVYRYSIEPTYLGERSYTDEAYGDTGYRILNPPAVLLATDGDYPDRVRLDWSKAHGAEGYKIYRDGIDPKHLVATVGDVDSRDDAIGDFDTHTYRLRSVSGSFLSEFSEADEGYRNRFIIHEVDQADAAEYVSLTVLDGKPAMSYCIGDSLKFARALTAMPGSHEDWDVHVVDTAVDPGPDDVGEGCSLAVIAGKPAISYIDELNEKLTYARALIAAPSDSSDWTTHVIADASHWGGDTRLVELGGVPALCMGMSLYPTLFARASTAAPTDSSDWLTHTVAGNYKDPLSLAVLDGKPALTSSFLNFGQAAVPLPSETDDWDTHEIEREGSGGALTVLNGRPAVCYSTGWLDTQALVFAYAINDTPTTSSHWLKHVLSREYLGGITSGGWAPSLAVVDGRPAAAYIGYDEEGGGFLRFAWSSVAIPTVGSDWDIRTVVYEEHGLGIGEQCSLVELNGKPIIAYGYGMGPYFAQGQ